MEKLISIEYCTSWGYLARAVALTETILNEHKNSLGMVNIIPSTGGVYEIKFGDELIFSKKELKRFPNDNEIEDIIRKKLA